MKKILQNPQLGIETVRNTTNEVALSAEQLPWLNDVRPSIHVAEVSLESGDTFLYGSAIGLHNGTSKLAKKVPHEQSDALKLGLFKALPEMLQNRGGSLPTNIDTVPPLNGTSSETIYKVAKRGRNAARLYFMITETELGEPLVLKLGIAGHSDQMKLQGYFTGKRTTSKHDG